MDVLLPAGWPRPKGYANGISARGRLVFVAGQIGWTPDGVFQATDFAGQFRQTLLTPPMIMGVEFVVCWRFARTSFSKAIEARFEQEDRYGHCRKEP